MQAISNLKGVLNPVIKATVEVLQLGPGYLGKEAYYTLTSGLGAMRICADDSIMSVIKAESTWDPKDFPSDCDLSTVKISQGVVDALVQGRAGIFPFEEIKEDYLYKQGYDHGNILRGMTYNGFVSESSYSHLMRYKTVSSALARKH